MSFASTGATCVRIYGVWASVSAAVVTGPATIQDWFWTVLLSVVIGGGVIALITFIGTGKMYQQIGRGGLSINEDKDLLRGPSSSSVAVNAQERDAEIRQLLQARNERRIRRGEEPLDIEAELERLTAPAIDPALREEIRQLVVARNERRMRAGQEPLEVEAEVERQIRDLA
jgi:hypothetical protein